MLDRFTIAAILILTLAACGGGGSGSQSNMMPPMLPTQQPASLHIPSGSGLSIGSTPPIYATTQADTRLSRLKASSDNRFRVYSASINRISEDGIAGYEKVEIGDRAITALRSDGDYGFHITYRDGEGQYDEHHYDKESFNSSNNNYDHRSLGRWQKSINAFSSVPFNGMNYGSTETAMVSYIGSTGRSEDRSIRWRISSAYGMETPSSALPLTTATYARAPGAWADVFDSKHPNDRYFDSRTSYRGDSSLTVNFADNSFTGRIDWNEIRRPGSNEWNSHAGTGFSFTGQIVNGQWHASMTGTEAADYAGQDADSMDGYSGNALGAIYGPDAEAMAGVFVAETMEAKDIQDGGHRVMIGQIVGAQDNNGN